MKKLLALLLAVVLVLGLTACQKTIDDDQYSDDILHSDSFFEDCRAPNERPCNRHGAVHICDRQIDSSKRLMICCQRIA